MIKCIFLLEVLFKLNVNFHYLGAQITSSSIKSTRIIKENGKFKRILNFLLILCMPFQLCVWQASSQKCLNQTGAKARQALSLQEHLLLALSDSRAFPGLSQCFSVLLPFRKNILKLLGIK